MAGESDLSVPWHHQYAVAAFSAESVARLVDPSVADQLAVFNSALLKTLSRLRRGFTLDIGIAGTSSEEARFAGAVLAKLAQRGFPAPCSLDLERHLVEHAQEVGLLARECECVEAEAFVFKPSALRQDLASLLKACFFAELILADGETEALFDCYRSVCTPPEREFYNLVLQRFPDSRVALFLTPQRLMPTMVRLTRGGLEALAADQRVDFALEVPNLESEGWLRLVVEIDDASHEGAQQELDAQRDQVLQSNGWEVWRLPVSAKASWATQAQSLADRLRRAITDEVLEAARRVRECLPEVRRALTDLVLLPIAEAQLTVAIARWLSANGTAGVRIANPQGLNLEPVLDRIGDCLAGLETLYGLPNLGRPTLANPDEEGDVSYLAFPSAHVWERLRLKKPVVLGPTGAFSEYEDALFMDATPRTMSTELAKDESRVSDVLTYFLQNIFRKVKFREGQVEIIHRALQLKPVVGLLPAAAGKSACYQMASLLQPGFTVVVQPLRSLMWDQTYNLDAIGIHRCIAIMSHGEVTQDEDVRLKEEGYRAIGQGFRFFVFVSPERFQIPEFREQVKGFVLNQPIPYCVVDEAHCVSEWGHDFRPAYLVPVSKPP